MTSMEKSVGKMCNLLSSMGNKNAQLNAKSKKQGTAKQAKKQGANPPKKQSSAAAAYATALSTGKAQVHRDSVDSCRIRHRELLNSITGTSAFNILAANSFSLNPGLPASFPWLSIEAQGWEKYVFNKLKLCYYTRTGSATAGSVMLIPDYDAADGAPLTEQIASSYHGVEEDAPWKDIELVFDSHLLKGERFIRTTGLAPNLDIKTYDVGTTYVGTNDGSAVAWGKVWIEYDVTLINPQLPPNGANVYSGTLTSGGGSVAAATPFGSVPVALGTIILSGAATNVLSFSGLSIGTAYDITAYVSGGTITNVSFGTLVGIASQNQYGPMFNTAATQGCTIQTVLATATSGKATLSVTAASVNFSAVVMCIMSPTPAF